MGAVRLALRVVPGLWKKVFALIMVFLVVCVIFLKYYLS